MGSPVDRLAAALADRYRIVRELGAGGMATVYLADDLKHDRKVALKVLKPELAAVVGGERFVAEIRTTANLQHPHILPLFDSGQSDGFLWYVMPYVEGESLEERLGREKQLPVDEAVDIAVKVAGALQAAHDHGVIHRDVKPANILLSRGEPLVADFGIALAVQEAGAGRLTETGLSLGTPWYMSPEQATADRDPDARSDVYALGCVLYQMLTGEPPFGGGTAQAVLGRILTADPAPATRLRRSVPAHVDAAVLRALEKTPADRFPSAAAFARALQDPSSTVAVGTASAATGAAPSRRAIAPWLPWVVAATLGGLAAWGWLRPSATSSPGPAVLSLALPPDSGETALAISPDGRTIASTDRQGPILVRTLDGPEWRPLPGTEGATGVAFSPDGRHLAFERGRAILRVPVTGGTPLTLAPARDRDSFELHWGEDGHIAFVSDAGIFRIAAEGGPVESFQAGVNAADPFVLPDGSILFWYFGSGGVALLDPATDSVRSLLSEGVRPVFLASGHLVYGVPSGGLRAVRYRLGSDGVEGSPVPLLDGVDARGWVLSRSGTLVYEPSSSRFAAGRARLVRTDAEGAVLDTLPLAEHRIVGLDVSPDGGTVAVVGEARETDVTQLFTYDLRRLDALRLITDEVVVLPEIVWTAGGDSLVYGAVDAGTPDLFIRSREGGPRRAVRRGAQGFSPSDVAGPGELLANRFGGGDEGDLVWVPLDGEAPVRTFLATPAAEIDAKLSPSGGRVAYVSIESGVPRVALRSYPDGLEPRSVGPGESPRWSRDGSRLYFIRNIPGPVPDTLKVVSIEDDGSVGEPRALLPFDFWGYDVLPGGGLLLAMGTGGPSSVTDPSLDTRVIILDWLASIRDRLGN